MREIDIRGRSRWSGRPLPTLTLYDSMKISELSVSLVVYVSILGEGLIRETEKAFSHTRP